MALQKGSEGADVTALQNGLVGEGYYVGAIDGKFGDKTDAAVRYLQSCHGLDIDGVVGDQVYTALSMPSVSTSVQLEVSDGERITAANPFTVSVTGQVPNPPLIRLVTWFRVGEHEEHTEQQVQPEDGVMDFVAVEIPAAIRAGADGHEIRVTAYAFDLQGSQLHEAFGSFTLDTTT